MKEVAFTKQNLEMIRYTAWISSGFRKLNVENTQKYDFESNQHCKLDKFCLDFQGVKIK